MPVQPENVELLDPLSFRDLISDGALFVIDTDRMVDVINDEILTDNEGGSDDEFDSADEFSEEIRSPWMKTFSNLKANMIKLPGEEIFKRVLSHGNGEMMIKNHLYRIQWSYNMFFESEKIAFDSSYLGGKQSKIVTSDGILPGLWLAVLSMKKGEESQFVIHHSLLYGIHGCPPRIKPKADVLFVVKLIDFNDIGNNCDGDVIQISDHRKFQTIKPIIIEKQKRAIDHFKNKRVTQAKMINHEAVRALELCQVADDAEQMEQRELLVQLYTHLSDCYLELEDWKKVCSMINEARRFANVNRNVKLLINEAIAISHFADGYDRSIELLKRAQRIEPNNRDVNNTLSSIIQDRQKYNAECKDLWQRAFQTKGALDDRDKAVDIAFKPTLDALLQLLDDDENTTNMPLTAYTKSELDSIRRLLSNDPKHRFKVTHDKNGNPKFVIEKLQ